MDRQAQRGSAQLLGNQHCTAAPSECSGSGAGQQDGSHGLGHAAQ